MKQITIASLNIYPVKSLKGIALQSAFLTPQGLAHFDSGDNFSCDRRFMIINSYNRFLTARQCPHMLLIRSRINGKQLILSAPDTKGFEKSEEFEGFIGLDDLIIDLHKSPQSKPIDVQIWQDTCQAFDEGDRASEWISRALNMDEELRLVRIGNQPRPQSEEERYGADTHTFFADSAPFLVTNTQSLFRLNETLNENGIDSVPMERFRPNIVLSGIEPFDEHNFAGLIHKNYEFKFCYPCSRCNIPSIDLDSGIPHPEREPFSLLAKINSMPNQMTMPAFGENSILLTGEGNQICIGDEVELVYKSDLD